jgi:hypothetical protein
MARALKARPTEYKGVRYRSKCEAMFARWLDLECKCDQYDGFSYEPNICGWIPDFIAWKTTFIRKTTIPEISYSIIEYKPSIPTDTYLDEFVERCRFAKGFLESEGPFSSSIDFKLFFGSVFPGGQCGVVQVEQDFSGWYTEDYDWLNLHRGSILSTRFDLRHGATRAKR